MRRQVYRIVPVVLLGALALSGCSGGDDPGGDAKPAGAKEAWLNGNANDLQLDQAVAQLARQCMEAKGFAVHPADPTSGEQQVTNPDELVADPGPALDPAQAAANGYGFDPRGGGESAEPDPGGSAPPEGGDPAENPGGEATPPPGGEGEGPGDDGERFYTELTEAQQSEYWVALDGVDKNKFLNEYYEKHTEGAADGEEPQLPTYEQVALADGTKRQYPTQGCQAEVNARVFTEGMPSYLEKEHLAEESFAKVVSVDLEQGADMKALADRWSQCMAGRGYEGLASPNDAYETASAYYWGGQGTENGESPAMPSGAALDEAKAKEVKLAVAHAGCDQEAGYTTGRAALMKGALDTFVADHDADLRAWDAYVTKALGAAQALLGK